MPSTYDPATGGSSGGMAAYWARTGGVLSPTTSGDLARLAIEDKGGQVYNVKAFGAVGDGSHDDTAAIQEALDEVPNSLSGGAKGGIVFLPPGVYKITDPLVLTTWYTKLVGSGGWVYNVATGSPALLIQDTEEIILQDLQIRGYYASNPLAGTTGAGIELDGSRNIRMVRVCQRYAGTYGVYLHGGVWRVLFDNCRFDSNTQSGIEAMATGATTTTEVNALQLVGTHCSDNGGNGLHWCGSGLNVNGGDFSNNGALTVNGSGDYTAGGISIDALQVGAFGATIIGTYHEQNYGGSIRLISRDLGSGVYAVVDAVEIIGNSMLCTAANSSHWADALIVGDAASTTYSQNIHIGTNSYGINDTYVKYYVNLNNWGKDVIVEEGGDAAAYYHALGSQKTALSRGHLPASPTVLATGASHTVDDVIGWLQTNGYCKQS